MAAVLQSHSAHLHVQGQTPEAPMGKFLSGLSAHPGNITLFVRMTYVEQYLWIIVYKEISFPLCNLSNLCDVFHALIDATSGKILSLAYYIKFTESSFTGIEVLHILGYIHCNISTGNILVVKDPANPNPGRSKFVI